MLFILLIVLLAIGLTALIFGSKNIVKSIGFWMIGLVTVFVFMLLLIFMYVSTTTADTIIYVDEREEVEIVAK